jgi:hypothetical protein
MKLRTGNSFTFAWLRDPARDLGGDWLHTYVSQVCLRVQHTGWRQQLEVL